MLSGEGDPPPALNSEEEMLKKVEKTKGAIGFVSYELVNSKVKVLAILEIEKE
jgi:ABC-type phosphate transport system substrate-binding protein